MNSKLTNTLERMLPFFSFATVISLIGGEVVRFTAFSVPIYPFELFVLITLCISALTYRRRLLEPLARIPKQAIYGIVLVLFALAVSTAQSDALRESLGATKSWFCVPLLFVVAILPSKEARHASLLGIVALACSHVVGGAILGLQGFSETERFAGLFNSANHFTALAVPALLLSIFLIRKPLNYALAGLLLLSILASASLGGILGLLIALAGLALIKARGTMRILLTAVVVVISVFAISIAITRFANLEGTSLHSRLQIWETSLHIISDNPIFGTGLRGFPSEYNSRVGDLFGVPVQWSAEEAHNIFLAIQTNLGVFGLIGFILLGTSLFRFKHEDKKTLVLSLVFLSIISHGLVDAPFFKMQIAVVTWVLIGCAIARDKPEAIQT